MTLILIYITDAQAYLEGVSAELLYGDEHLDVVAAEAGVDPAGHGELEAAEAAHEEVDTVLTHTTLRSPGHHEADHQARHRHRQQLAQHREVVIAGPA